MTKTQIETLVANKIQEAISQGLDVSIDEDSIKEITNEAVASDRKNISAQAKAVSDLQSKVNILADRNTELNEIVEALKANKAVKTSIEIKASGKTVSKTKEALYHRQFKEVFTWMTSRNASGWPTPVWAWGGAGVGKTHMGQQIAEALKLTFYPVYLGPTTTEAKLLGFRNASLGEYIKGLCVEAFHKGGVLFLDEIDAADPSVIVAINALLSNDTYRFPDGKLYKRHKDFYVLCGANTLGKGAQQGFKRNAMDAASLNRFAKVEIEIDEALELVLSGNENFTKYVQRVRNHLKSTSKMTVHITPRDSAIGAAALANGITPESVCKSTLFAMLSEDNKQSVINTVGYFDPSVSY